jgi:hypothetical protein
MLTYSSVPLLNRVERGLTIGIKSVNILPIPLDIIILKVVGAVEIDGSGIYVGDGCQTDCSTVPYHETMFYRVSIYNLRLATPSTSS